MAWQPWFFGPYAVLVCPHDWGVDHGPFIVGILGQGFEHALPHARSAPAAVAQMNHAKVAKALRQITPGNTGAIAIEHGIHKQAVVGCGAPHMSSPAGQKVFDELPLRIREGISACHALDNAAGALFDDTP